MANHTQRKRSLSPIRSPLSTLHFPALLALALLLAGTALAQNWTVQTVAFRNYQEAQGVVEELRSLGFAAYSQFAMSDGKQYTRVRVGCYTDKAGAEALATELKGRLTKEAVALPADAIPATIPCVRYDLGFRLPKAWGVVRQDASLVLFWVKVAGRKGYVAFDGAWHVLQDTGELASLEPLWEASAPAVTPTTFRTVERRGYSFIEAISAIGQPDLIASGKLLWHSPYAAVAQDGDKLVALSLVGGGQ
jgi:hypothetical protein